MPPSLVRDVHVETLEEVCLYQIFGLRCGGPQSVLFDGEWQKAESVLWEPQVYRDAVLVGLALDHGSSVVVDNVACCGLDLDCLRVARVAGRKRRLRAAAADPSAEKDAVVDVSPMEADWSCQCP